MMTSSNHTNDFLSKIDELIQNDQLFKITLSKPRPQNKDVHNVYLKTADIKHQLQYSLTYRYK
ncbi:MAG TPA: hypothetical protein PJ990_16060, partial [Saprospiraceae bacterium]|nr:hypothetical protein [Saprospiraceae bacterium]